jgi:hypothetical protein
LRTFAMGFEEKKPVSKMKRRRWVPRMAGDWLGA